MLGVPSEEAVGPKGTFPAEKSQKGNYSPEMCQSMTVSDMAVFAKHLSVGHVNCLFLFAGFFFSVFIHKDVHIWAAVCVCKRRVANFIQLMI